MQKRRICFTCALHRIIHKLNKSHFCQSDKWCCSVCLTPVVVVVLSSSKGFESGRTTSVCICIWLRIIKPVSVVRTRCMWCVSNNCNNKFFGFKSDVKQVMSSSSCSCSVGLIVMWPLWWLLGSGGPGRKHTDSVLNILKILCKCTCIFCSMSIWLNKCRAAVGTNKKQQQLQWKQMTS